MKKGVKGLLMLSVIIMITCSIFSLEVKAATPDIIIKKLTQTSVDVDYSEAIKKKIKELGVTSYYNSTNRNTFPKFDVKCDEYNNRKHGDVVFESNAPRTIANLNDSITGLKPHTKYWISVTYKLTTDDFDRFLHMQFITPDADSNYTIKQAGCTDTSVTIDMRAAYKSVMENAKKKDEGSFYLNYSAFIGCVKKTGSNDAKAEALNLAINRNSKTGDSAYYTIKNLEPSSHYAVCVMLLYDGSMVYKPYTAYFTIDDIYTAAKGTYAELASMPKYNTENGKIDTYMASCEDDNIDTSNSNISTSTTETSITLDWSKRTGDKEVSDVKIGYALCSNIDLDKDKEEYGSADYVGAKGPYYREAYKMCDAGKISVPASAKSYTIKNLEPGKLYAVAIRCKSKSGNTKYYYKKIGTKGTYLKSYEYISDAIKNNKFQMPSMYDAKTYKEGNSTIVDWTEALNAFLAQDFWKNLNARPCDDKLSYIAYEEAAVESSNRYDSYNVAPEVDWTKAISSEKYATKARIFGLDPAKKYVFGIRTNVTYFYRGDKYDEDFVFYVDETGTNFVKLKKLGEDRASREYRAKVAALKNNGVLNVDISAGNFALSGYQAKALVDILMIAGEHNSVLYPVRHGIHYLDGQYYGYDLNGDNEDDIRLFYSDLETPAKCSIRFAKADDCTVTANNLSYTFDNAAIADIQKKCVENNYTGYYSGINFIFKNPNKVEDKKDDKSSKDKSDNSSKKKSDGSKKDKKDNSSKDSKTNNNSNSENKNKTDNNSGNASSSAKNKKSIKITYKGYKYEITSSNTVKLVAPTKKSVKSVNVPAKIKYSKKTYKVTEIGDSAFKGCKKLQKVTISSNVKTIGKKAFYGCKKLKSVEIKSKNLKRVGKKAFDKTSKNLKISVPKKKLKNYKNVLKKSGVKSGKLKAKK